MGKDSSRTYTNTLPGMALAFGAQVERFFRADLRFGVTGKKEIRDEFVGRLKYYLYDVDLNGYFTYPIKDFVIPYLGLCLGMHYMAYKGGWEWEKLKDFGTGLTSGIDVLISNKFSVGTEIRYQSATSEDWGNFSSWTLSLGLKKFF